jgi:hypothetical protein
MPVTLSMSVLNIQISRERLFIFFHDNDHNDALSLHDRSKICPIVYVFHIAYYRCLAKIFKKAEKPYRYRGIKKTDTENRTDLEKIPSEIPKTDTELKKPTPTQV